MQPNNRIKEFVMTVSLLAIGTFFLMSCATSTSINLLCNEQQIEIYVDGEYVGRGLVNYIVPKGLESINVSCRNNGIEIYSRTYYVKGKQNQLFELSIPKDYHYSSGQPVKPRAK